MKFVVEVQSEKIIKPSSRTPDHLTPYKLSRIDQTSPPVYISWIYFYTGTAELGDDHCDKLGQLERSLSRVLTIYYPLAGRLNDAHDFVACDDRGVQFVQAQANCKLTDVLQNPHPGELHSFLPFKSDGPQDFLLGVQFNVFECGGIGIGVSMSHKIADALSFFTFVKAWVATTRSTNANHQMITTPPVPKFDSAKLFPPAKMAGNNSSSPITKENVVAKRFLFGQNSIDELIAKTKLKRPSRVQVLSVFIWSRIAACTKVKQSEKDHKQTVIIHLVNLRSKTQPPLSENSFGNYYWFAPTFPTPDAVDQPWELVNQMRTSISRVDNNCVKMLQQGEKGLAAMGAQASKLREMVWFSFTSLCRFPVYDADFGWGKPVWAGFPTMCFKNQIVFKDTVSGDGIEALVHLTKQDMAKFQQDKELLQFATAY